MKRISALFLVLSLLLAGCGKNAEFPIPQGIQTIRAILKPVAFSLKRRGTHALIAPDGKMAAYAESTAVNLHVLEGREVELQGIFEKNSDPAALPVFVVQKVLNGGDDALRAWTIPVLRLSINVPRNWKGSIQGSSANFTASGFTAPALTITQKQTPSANPESLYGPAALPDSAAAGEPLVVGLRKAVAHTDDVRHSWIVRVTVPASGGSDTVFTFSFDAHLTDEQQRASFTDILATVQFSSAGGSSRSPSSGSMTSSSADAAGSSGSVFSRAAGDGAPCGGSAGILCPKGLFCKISDTESESGICTKR